MHSVPKALNLKTKGKTRGGGGRISTSCSFLRSMLDGGKWSTSRSGHFTTEKETLYPLNDRVGLDVSQRIKFSFNCQDSNLVPSGPKVKSLYPLRYPVHHLVIVAHFMVHRYTESLSISVGSCSNRRKLPLLSVPNSAIINTTISSTPIHLCSYDASLNHKNPNIHYHFDVVCIVHHPTICI